MDSALRFREAIGAVEWCLIVDWDGIRLGVDRGRSGVHTAQPCRIGAPIQISQCLGPSWTRRAILTPKPRLSWGEREHQLEQAGFIVAPANTSGLRTIAKAFRVAEGTDPAVTDEDPNEDGYESYPPMLEDVPSRWLEDEAPSREVLRELLLELRQFLGERGFYWCCACTAFPKLHPELTLHLGATLTTSAGSADGSEEGLLALSCLPWFRQGFMPDWLRLALLSELTEEQKRKIRTALTDVLMTAKAGADSGLVLNISDRASSLVTDFLARSTSHNDPFNPVQEEIFLSFLRGRQLPPLAIVAPPTLVQAIRRRIETVQMALWGGAAFVAGLLWWYNPWPHLLSALSFEILAGLLLATIILGLLRISCRASAERGPIVVGSWLVGGLVLIVSLVGVFEAAEIAWGGLEANDTGRGGGPAADPRQRPGTDSPALARLEQWRGGVLFAE